MDLEFRNRKHFSRGAALASAVAVAVLFSCAYPTSLIAQAAKPAKPKGPIPFHLSQPEPINFDDHEGWTQIFDGKTLKNWDGDTDVWHVEDGAIVGESSPEHPSGTTNILWRGGEPANFRLKLEMKLEGSGANGGIQYRSFRVEPYLSPVPADLPPEQRERRLKQLELDKKHARWNLSGYQADYDFANHYTGQLYEQSSPRTIIAWPGQVVASEPAKKPTLLALLGTPDEMKSFIKPDEWNQVEIIADGNILTHIINGHVMAVVIDTDPKYSQAKGLIALEIEGSGNLKIRHRNIWLKKLP